LVVGRGNIRTHRKNRLVDLSTVNEAYSVSAGIYLGYHMQRGGLLKNKKNKIEILEGGCVKGST
jgi:hypothetical protein